MRLSAIVGGEVVGRSGASTGHLILTGTDIESLEAVGTRREVSALTEPHEGGVLNASGCTVAPGLIDLQINGAFGVDLTSEPERIGELAARLPELGVTAFLPTLVSASPSIQDRAVAALAACSTGAVPLGLHLEGPWLVEERRGAHANDPRPFDSDDARRLAAYPRPLLVTGAAERLDRSTVEALVAHGVTVSIGHSDASFEDASDVMDAGASMVTHLFNAMSGLHHREPGVAAAALAGGVALGLIVDGVHVHPAMVELAWKMAPDRVVLVSDAVAALGVTDTTWLGAHRVVVDDDSVRLSDGTLAGSLLTLPRAIRLLIEFTGCSLAEAVTAASTRPAGVVGDSARGALEPGRRADVTVLDRELDVVATVVGGEVVHLREEDRWRL